MRTKFKAWAEPYINEHPEVSLLEEEIKQLDNVYLEIGSGKGDFIVQMANKFPKLKFVGIEKNVTCAGFCYKKIVTSGVKNAKMLFNDATNVTPLIKDKSVNVIFLNFSDPWPKVRHHKRRLTSEKFLKEYLRILKDDGKIIFKTDNVDLFEYSIEMLPLNGFKIVSKDSNYDGLEEFDAQTEYETSFREKGVPINRLVVVKAWLIVMDFLITI